MMRALSNNILICLLALMALFNISCNGGGGGGVGASGGGSSSSSANSMTITKFSGDGQYAASNAAFSDPIIIQVAGGETISGVPIQFSIASGSVAGSLSSSAVTTDATGKAQVIVNTGAASGIISVVANIIHSSGAASSTTFTLNVNGAATNWSVTPSGAGTEVAGTTFTLDIQPLKADLSVDTTFSGSKSLTFTTTAGNSPGGNAPSLPVDGFYTFTDGVIDTIPSVTLYDSSENGADTFTVTVAGSGLSDGVTTAITVNDDVKASVKIMDSDSCAALEYTTGSMVIPATLSLYAYYHDAYDNCIEKGTDQANVDWSKTWTDLQVTFTGGVVGVQSQVMNPIAAGAAGSVSITDSTYSDSTGSIDVSNGIASSFIIIGFGTSGNFTLTAGVAYQILFEARDPLGNIATAYTGAKSITTTTTATATSPLTALGVGANSPSIPAASTAFTFVNGVYISPVPTVTLYNTEENPIVTIYDGGSCGGSNCGISTPVTVSNTALTYALIRTQALNAGGNGATFDGTAVSTTADDSYTFYCASYDTFGNYIQDVAAADWGRTNTIVTGDLSATTGSSIVYSAKAAGTGTIYCDIDGVNDGAGLADDTALITVAPGAPTEFRLDGGGGEAAAFTVSAGDTFSVTVNLYDADGNFASNYTNASYATTVSYVGSTSLNTSYPAEVTPAEGNAQITGTNVTTKTVNLNIGSGTATLANMKLINDTEDSDEPKVSVVDQAAIISTGTSGAITNNQNTLASISIRNLASNAGSYINAPTTNTDQTMYLYAAGYDKAGNYLGDQTVDWTNTAPSGNCGLGELTGNPVPTTATVGITWDPTQYGSCVITAYHGGTTFSDTTGTMTIMPGGTTNYTVALLGGGSTVTAGSAFSVVITAVDASVNRVLGYLPDTSYTFTTTAGNSPEGTSPAGFTLSPSDWSFGQAIVTGVYVYDTSGTFTMTATETGTSSTFTGTSGAITVNPNTLHHYSTTATSGSFVADGSTTFGVTIEARDEWGNATTTGIGALLTLTAIQMADEATVDAVANGAGLDLAGSASKSFTGLTYRVSHQAEFVATDTNAKTTPSGIRTNATFTAVAATVNDYLIDTFSTTTPTAGVALTGKIYARDIMGNTLTGFDGTLDTYSFTIGSGANSSDYSNAPSHPSGTSTFTSGVSANISFTFYNEETVSLASFTLNDGAGTNVAASASASAITVGEDAFNHYSNQTSSGTYDADGTTVFDAILKARDQWGNIVTGDASISLGVNQITGGSAGTLGGSTTSINMTSGTSTISDLTYDVAGQMELTTSGGTVSLTAGQSVDYTFGSTPASIAQYALSWTANPTAGTPFVITVTAQDVGGNTVTDQNAHLNGLTFSFAGLNNSPESDAPTPSGTFSITNFVLGVGTTPVTFVNAEAITAGNLTLTDNYGSPRSGTTGSTITVSPDAADHIVFVGATSGTGDNSTNYSVTIEARDQFGNINATGNGADASLDLESERVSGLTNVGPLTGTGITTIDLQSNATVTISDINYQVAHTMRYKFAAGTPSSIAIDNTRSTVVTWAMDKATVASYTIEPDNGTVKAGTATNFTLTAFDGGSNIIVGEDATLNTINYTFTTSTDCDAPLPPETAGGSDPANTTKTFTNGITSLSYTFYDTAVACLTAADVRIDDTDNTLFAVNVGTMTITQEVADHIEYSTGTAQTSVADICSAALITVRTLDQFGNITTDNPGGTTVNLSSDSTGDTFYTDACTSSTTSVVVADATSTQTFYYKDTLSSSHIMSLTVGGFTSQPVDTDTYTINPAVVDYIEYSTGTTQTLAAGVCSAVITARTKDQFGNITTDNPGGTLINLTTGSGSGTFYSDACSTSTTAVTVADASSTKTFYYDDTLDNGPTLTMTGPGFTTQNVDTTVFTINPAVADHIEIISGSGQTSVAGVCSATAITVRT
ncbi:MAG: hypothetical protein HOE90_06690, partial [Bacteriovoracaceae bacterium]|nr:hypothetical protein [Bacteriovoracaceae bacterium]